MVSPTILLLFTCVSAFMARASAKEVAPDGEDVPCNDDKTITCADGQRCCTILKNVLYSCCRDANGICCKSGRKCCPEGFICCPGETFCCRQHTKCNVRKHKCDPKYFRGNYGNPWQLMMRPVQTTQATEAGILAEERSLQDSDPMEDSWLTGIY